MAPVWPHHHGEERCADRRGQEWAADALGSAIINLNALEAKLPEVLEAIAAEKAAVMENITVAG